MAGIYQKKFFGPRPAFTQIDVARFLWLLRGKQLSRGRLCVLLGLGEGSVRTIIESLRRERLILVRRRGCVLSEKGARFAESVFSKIVSAGFVQATSLSYGKKAFAIIARNAGGELGNGLRERDAAVQAGAIGATLLSVNERGLSLPGGYYRVGASDKTILSRLSASKGDVIVLGYGENGVASERGAWSAVFSLLRITL